MNSIVSKMLSHTTEVRIIELSNYLQEQTECCILQYAEMEHF